MELVAPDAATRVLWTGTSDVVVTTSTRTRQGRYEAGAVSGFDVGGDSAVTIATTRVPGRHVLGLYPIERPDAYGADPERSASAAPKHLRHSISTSLDETLWLSERSNTPRTRGGTAGESLSPRGPRTEVPGETKPMLCDPQWYDCADPCYWHWWTIECGGDGVSPEPPPPQPLPPNTGYDIGISRAQCVSPSSDADRDGIDDGCEFSLAHRFRPFLKVSPQDGNLIREPYWSVAPGDGVLAPADAIQIMYLLAYREDPGWYFASFSGHAGDSEFVIVRVRFLDGRWQLWNTTMSAHWGTEYDATGIAGSLGLEFPDGTFAGRPLIYVAKHKHANYNNNYNCDAGGRWSWDRCGDNVFVLGDPRYEVEVLPQANIGNGFASGPYDPVTARYVPIGVPLINLAYSRLRYFPYPERFWSTQGGFCDWMWPPDGLFNPGCAGPYLPALQAYRF